MSQWFAAGSAYITTGGRHSPEYLALHAEPTIATQPNADGLYPVGQVGRDDPNEYEDRGNNDPNVR